MRPVTIALMLARTDRDERLGVYNAVGEGLVSDKLVSVNAMMPSLLVEVEYAIVAAAVLDLVLLSPAEDVAPMTSVCEVITWLDHDITTNRGATIGGLVIVDDRRIHQLLQAMWSSSTTDEVNAAIRARTGSPNIATFEFWLRWLDYLMQRKVDDLFGVGACSLGLLLRDMKVKDFTQGLRPLGAGPALHTLPPTDNPEILPVEEVAVRFAERLYAIEAAEPAPKVTSYLLRLYGLEPRAPRSQQYVA